MLMRVQKFLAHQGVASRRAIEKMINEGRVRVNGAMVMEQGTKIDPSKDQIIVDGRVVETKDRSVYFWLNKPIGIISAATSKSGETTVADLIDTPVRIYPVGRLDKESQGLILLTNDGELTHRLTHPKYHIDKTYLVQVTGNVNDVKLEKLRTGIELDEGMTQPAEVNIVEERDHGALMQFTIHEGKNRQIRRMCAIVHLPVTVLTRTSFGPIELGRLATGKSRTATIKEISILYKLTKLSL